MKTALLLIVLSTASVAYAGEKPVASDTSEATAAPATDDKGTICEMKKEVGSNRVKRVCTTEEERLMAKAKAHADLERLGRCSGNENACRGDL
jgi:hypothetical protein